MFLTLAEEVSVMTAGRKDGDTNLKTANGITELQTHVQCRLGRQLRHFRVLKTEQGLVLRGFARTYYAKQLAQHAVLEATTLPIAANEIEVC
jgi:hypothetical protein